MDVGGVLPAGVRAVHPVGDQFRTGVVGGQGQGLVASESLQLVVQVGRAKLLVVGDAFGRVGGQQGLVVWDSKVSRYLLGGRRHQLHGAHGALGGYRCRVSSAFLVGHGIYQRAGRRRPTFDRRFVLGALYQLLPCLVDQVVGVVG